jgi:lipoprotein signal peptidase
MLNTHHDSNKYWFRAKRYGCGWGFPSNWKGWLCYTAYIGLIVIFTFIFPPGKKFAAFIFLTSGLGAILIILFWTKGEPPRRKLENDKDAEDVNL